MANRANWGFNLALTVVVAVTGTLVLGAATLPGKTVETGVAGTPYMQLAQDVAQGTLMSEGRPLYERNCAMCHGANGQGGDGPKLAGNELIQQAGAVISQILVGAEEHGMPPFKDVLKDREIAAITTYMRNSWGHSFGAVQPDTVKSMRGG